MCVNTCVMQVYILHMYYMYINTDVITCIADTCLIHMFYTCNNLKKITCNTGMAQLVM